MVKVSAFKSLRPLQNIVEKVTTQPYSNYTQDEIKKELQKNKFSFLNIIANNQSNDLKESIGTNGPKGSSFIIVKSSFTSSNIVGS